MTVGRAYELRPEAVRRVTDDDGRRGGGGLGDEAADLAPRVGTGNEDRAPLMVVEPAPAEVDPFPTDWFRLSVKLKAGEAESVGGTAFEVAISMSWTLMICTPFSTCERGWPVPINVEAVPNGVLPLEVVEELEVGPALTPAASR